MSEVFCYVDLTDLATYVALDQILALSALSEVTYLPLMVSLSSASGRKPAQETHDPLAAYKARRQRARDAFCCSRTCPPADVGRGDPGYRGQAA